MKKTQIGSCICIGLVAASLALVGCAPKPYEKRYYYFSLERQYEPAKADNELVLELRPLTIDAGFNSKGLVYRKGEFEYESDFYNEFLVWPATMVTEKVRTWLSQTGLFARVPDGASSIQPTHTLEGNITALYGDLRERATPAAVIEIRFFLIENDRSKESLIWAKAYKGSCDASTPSAQALVEAFDRCLEKILTELEKDLSKKL
jgi:cholesterol transport system auxiliary component